jgi:hypothetical protein
MQLQHLIDVLSSTRISPVEGRKDVFERLSQALPEALKDLPKLDHQHAEISDVLEAEICHELEKIAGMSGTAEVPRNGGHRKLIQAVDVYDGLNITPIKHKVSSFLEEDYDKLVDLFVNMIDADLQQKKRNAEEELKEFESTHGKKLRFQDKLHLLTLKKMELPSQWEQGKEWVLSERGDAESLHHRIAVELSWFLIAVCETDEDATAASKKMAPLLSWGFHADMLTFFQKVDEMQSGDPESEEAMESQWSELMAWKNEVKLSWVQKSTLS